MVCGDDQILNRFPVFRLHQRGIEDDVLELALATQGQSRQARARNAFDFDGGEYCLQLLRPGLQIARLLEDFTEIHSLSPGSSSPSSAGSGTSPPVMSRTATTSAPGKRSRTA